MRPRSLPAAERGDPAAGSHVGWKALSGAVRQTWPVLGEHWGSPPQASTRSCDTPLSAPREPRHRCSRRPDRHEARLQPEDHAHGGDHDVWKRHRFQEVTTHPARSKISSSPQHLPPLVLCDPFPCIRYHLDHPGRVMAAMDVSLGSGCKSGSSTPCQVSYGIRVNATSMLSVRAGLNSRTPFRELCYCYPVPSRGLPRHNLANVGPRVRRQGRDGGRALFSPGRHA